MELLIKIPDEEYTRMKEKSMFGRVDVWKDAIRNGTPLPKGHGRLIDVDAVTKNFQAFYESFIINTARVGHFSIACLAPTILEADKEEQK